MQEILQQVAQGLGGLAMAHDIRQTALRHLERWLTEPAFEPSSPAHRAYRAAALVSPPR